MKNEFEILIDKDGSIEAIYQDGLAEALDAVPVEVKRASAVEWEVGGWTVRSAADPEIAIRYVSEESPKLHVSREGPIARFQGREEALKQEVVFFWDIIGQKPPRRLVCPRCDTEFVDPDPNKEFPNGIICPVCHKRAQDSKIAVLVGVIHPK